jgi:DNA modification methylase
MQMLGWGMSETRIKPQAKNANRHTQRGMQALETSLATDGWIGAITVAADGETFDGSARVEKTAENGMLDAALVIDSDGTRPIVVRRTDIPSATDPRAVRLGIAANRVASLNLEWEPDVLQGIVDSGIDLGALFTDQEWADVSAPSLPEPGGGGDEFDPTPAEGETRTALGQLWSIGGKHRLYVGDCTDAVNVARLMDGERAGAVVSDPPYGVEFRGNGWDKTIPDWLGSAHLMADTIVFTTGPTTLWEYPQPDWVGCWYREASNARAIWGGFSHWSPIVIYGDVSFPVDSIKLHAIQHMTDKDIEHPSPKPMALMEWLIEHSSGGDLVADPFLGSGTTLIAGHRLGRKVYGMEIAPRYADVILRRAEAEGLECVLTDG